MLKILLLVALTILSVIAQDPPVWRPRFTQNFIESYGSNTYKDRAKMWYDFPKGLSRIERTNGKFDPFCSSISTVATPCVQIVRDGKRHIIFPLLRLCCYCCDSAHGCGILRRDWLQNAKYVGRDSLDGEILNRWRDQDANIDYWAYIDPVNTPRKIAQGSDNFKDFEKITYTQNFPESIFELPALCNSQDTCPSTSLCAKFRG